MAKIIKLVSEWGNLAHRVSATPDQIGGQRRIASLEMLPDTEPLPHLICSRLIFGSGGGDEAGHHGDAR